MMSNRPAPPCVPICVRYALTSACLANKTALFLQRIFTFPGGNCMAKLGYIGLGAMGGRVAKRLLDAGHTVIGYNRTKAKAQWLLDAGLEWADSPREVAERADITFSMVTDTKALHTIFDGHNGILAGLSAGKVYVDMSTISPAASQ